MKNLKNFHVPLPVDLYQRLRKSARSAGRPATELAREAIALWLEQRRRESLHQALSEYTKRWAGTDGDLDEKLEAAGVEHLIDEVEP